MSRGRRAALATVLLGLVLSGCSSDTAASGAEGDGKPDRAADSGAAHALTTSPPRLPAVPALKGGRGIVDQLRLDECPTAAGPTRASGEVTNPTDTVGDVVVVLSWTNHTYDVLGRGVAVVKGLAPGATEQWSVEADLGEGVTTCTPSARVGELRSAG